MHENNISRWVERKARVGRGALAVHDATSRTKKGRSVSDWRPIALAGYTLICLTFGVGGVWAAIAEIDKAVIAQGYVATETNRKTVEHYEGGIVQEILIKEGDRVKEGQVLFRLQQVQAEASSETVQSQLDSALALEARLIAERDGTADITWPEELADHTGNATVMRVTADQTRQFNNRRASLEGQINVLQTRIDENRKEIDGIAREKDSTVTQVGYIEKELVGLRSLSEKQLVPVTRVYAMEREKTRMEGLIGRADADTAKAESEIAGMNLQIQQTRQKFQEEIAANLQDTRQKIAELRERVTVAKDVLRREEIVAPRAGTAQDLRVFTIGQVVRSGEALLQIVPDDEPLIVEAQFSPNDIDTIYAGMQTEIRFPAFHSRTIPVMLGKLQSISHDRLIDEASHQSFFRGLVSLNRADIPEEWRSRIRSGMPAEIIVAAGSRTVMSYLISPLTSSLRKSFREAND